MTEIRLRLFVFLGLVVYVFYFIGRYGGLHVFSAVIDFATNIVPATVFMSSGMFTTIIPTLL